MQPAIGRSQETVRLASQLTSTLTTTGYVYMQKQITRCCFTAAITVELMLFTTSIGQAQQSQAMPISIGQAVDSALRIYPSVTVSQEQVNAAAAGIDLARTAYLPRVDTLAQVNRATRNNTFGLMFPQGVIP